MGRSAWEDVLAHMVSHNRFQKFGSMRLKQWTYGKQIAETEYF